MLIKILGILDIFSSISFLGLHLGIFSYTVAIYTIVYLGIKFLIFRKDLVSIIDLFCGIFLLSMILGFRSHLVWIVSFYFLQKGLLSIK